MSEHPLCDDPRCGVCAQRRATGGYREVMGESGQELFVPNTSGVVLGRVECPACGHRFHPPGSVRVTETAVLDAAATKKPFGDVQYADPGYQDDKKARYPLDTEEHVRSAWSYVNQGKNAAKYNAADLKKVRARIKSAMKRFDIPASENSCTEAVINGSLSFDDIRELVRRAVQARMRSMADPYGPYCWAYIVDISDTDVVYEDDKGRLWLCSYTLADGEAQLGDPVEVARTYAPVSTDAPATERAQIDTTARVVEAKGTDGDGNRVFRVRIIAYGVSKNGRRYSESTLRAAAPLYEGAKAFDRHRTAEEMNSGTIAGLVGWYSDVEATDSGLEADLHLLPSATHAAEALDASLAAQENDREPLVGISHDAQARFSAITENGRTLQDCIEVVAVNSADVVSHPAAGGKATRVVAGGTEDPPGDRPGDANSTKESHVSVSTADVLAALKDAPAADLAAVAEAFNKAQQPTPPATEPEKATETVKPASYAKTDFLAGLMIERKAKSAGIEQAAESLAGELPERFTEAEVDARIASIKAGLAMIERSQLRPTVASSSVTKEALDKKVEALDAMFANEPTTGNWKGGYRSFREAFVDFTGARPKTFDEDFNRTILRESFGGGFSNVGRATESMDSTTWNLVLGDSITRRLVKMYSQPSLQSWRKIVSSTPPVNDFRTQRIERIGGYGVLPIVNQGAPYQPLTSPTNEEVTYVIAKRGGTEDITLEMIANDDVRAISQIPTKLGLAAAQTLYRFVWDIFTANAATTYDSTALFHASHANTDTNALSQSNLSVGRRKMLKQTAYGDSNNVLSITPAWIAVVSDLEEIAFQLAASAVAVPGTPAGPSDTPNIHQGLDVIRIDYWTSTTGWFLGADPMLQPTIEIGFYQGRQEPELFTQADQSTGAVFNADKITYKIRHIYSGAVLDHRGLYRGNA